MGKEGERTIHMRIFFRLFAVLVWSEEPGVIPSWFICFAFMVSADQGARDSGNATLK